MWNHLSRATTWTRVRGNFGGNRSEESGRSGASLTWQKQRLCDPFFHALSETHCEILLETCKTSPIIRILCHITVIVNMNVRTATTEQQSQKAVSPFIRICYDFSVPKDKSVRQNQATQMQTRHMTTGKIININRTVTHHVICTISAPCSIAVFMFIVIVAATISATVAAALIASVVSTVDARIAAALKRRLHRAFTV